MKRQSLLSLMAAGFIGLCAVSNARADETVKFRQFMHAISVQSQDVGDVDGHALSLVRFSGIATFPDGTTGTAYFVAAPDYTKGAGPFGTVYHNLTLRDGSVLWLKWVGTTTVEGTISRFQGTVTVLGGKGKYEGAKGDGTITGERIVPLAAGADLYQDLVINVKK
jgi:hypothetical protein